MAGLTRVEPARLSADEVREQVQAGRALFVCGYEDEEKCRQYHLEGAMSFKEFSSRLPSLSRDQGIILYCA